MTFSQSFAVNCHSNSHLVDFRASRSRMASVIGSVDDVGDVANGSLPFQDLTLSALTAHLPLGPTIEDKVRVSL
jgi:hypothetical protein